MQELYFSIPPYFRFAFFVLNLAALIWLLRWLYISWKAIRHHKRELARMAQIADAETMERYLWKG